MTITYMKEPVHIPYLLEIHKITELQLTKKINNCTDGKLKIGDNDYQLFKDDDIKNDYKQHKYKVTKDTVVIDDLIHKDIAKIVKHNTKYVYDRLRKNKENSVVINGWTIERM